MSLYGHNMSSNCHYISFFFFLSSSLFSQFSQCFNCLPLQITVVGVVLDFRQVLVFTSFVRCWVSDEQMLVAGLYNGALQAVHWKTGQKENID